jgi:hypothetical protein
MPPTGALVRRRGPGKSSARTAPYPKPSSDVLICPKHGKPGLPIDRDDEDKENSIPRRDNASKASSEKVSGAEKSPEREIDRSNLPESYRDIPLAEIEGEVPVYENVGILLTGL